MEGIVAHIQALSGPSDLAQLSTQLKASLQPSPQLAAAIPDALNALCPTNHALGFTYLL